MSALALKLPFDEPQTRPRRRLVPVGPPLSGRQAGTAVAPASLDRVMTLAWAALSAGHPVECPLCTGTLVPTPDGAGSCKTCGSTLAR